jgi:hypothetical protein
VIRTLALALFVAASALAAPAPARAQDVAGAVTGSFVMADGDPGAAAMLDVWAPLSIVRLGGFFGVSSIVSDRDAHNRVMMPVGASLALAIDAGPVLLSVVGRGGLWGGATQDVKLTIGGFVGGGVGLGFHISPSVSVSAQVELWGILGAGETWALSPGISIAWGHPEPESDVGADDGGQEEE